MKKFLHPGVNVFQNDNGDYVAHFDQPLVTIKDRTYNSTDAFLSDLYNTVFTTLSTLISEAQELKGDSTSHPGPVPNTPAFHLVPVKGLEGKTTWVRQSVPHKATPKKPTASQPKKQVPEKHLTEKSNVNFSENIARLNIEAKMQQILNNIQKSIDAIYNAVNLPESFKKEHENEIKSQIAREIRWDKYGNPEAKQPEGNNNILAEWLMEKGKDKVTEEVGNWPMEKLIEDAAKVLGMTAEKTIGLLADFLLEPTSMGKGDLPIKASLFPDQQRIKTAVDYAIRQVIYGQKPPSYVPNIILPSDATNVTPVINGRPAIYNRGTPNAGENGTYISD